MKIKRTEEKGKRQNQKEKSFSHSLNALIALLSVSTTMVLNNVPIILCLLSTNKQVVHSQANEGTVFWDSTSPIRDIELPWMLDSLLFEEYYP
jgi:hypothetical protein